MSGPCVQIFLYIFYCVYGINFLKDHWIKSYELEKKFFRLTMQTLQKQTHGRLWQNHLLSLIKNVLIFSDKWMDVGILGRRKPTFHVQRHEMTGNSTSVWLEFRCQRWWGGQGQVKRGLGCHSRSLVLSCRRWEVTKGAYKLL